MIAPRSTAGPSGEGELLLDHVPMARHIAARMKRRYTWIPLDDLYSYSLLGLTLAARAFDPARNVPFASFATRRAAFWAIDEMRKDGVLRRRDAQARPRTLLFGSCPTGDEDLAVAVPDHRADRAEIRLEARDLCEALYRRVGPRDRRLLSLYYADELTFREIGEVLGMSESGACLRHQALLRKFRAIASSAGVLR